MTLWLALDDVTAENGAMDMFTFNAVPEVLCLSLWTYYSGLCLILFLSHLLYKFTDLSHLGEGCK